MSSPQKILLVEDALDMQMIVRGALADRYSLTCAGTIGEAFHIMSHEQFSLVLLDIELPDENGFQFCNRLRHHEKHKDIPVIFLTARQLSEDKVTAFQLGAEDYIVKPIDVAEFRARIDAKMRKFGKTTSGKEFIHKGVFRVNLGKQKIVLNENGADVELDLRAFEYKLLFYLIKHEGKVLTREQILAEVWGQNLNVTDRTVDTHIYTLRKKMGLHASCIKTIPRTGYTFSLEMGRSETAELTRFNSGALDGLKIPGEGLNLVLQLTEALFQTTPPRLTKLKELAEKGNFTQAALEAHGLKSSVRTMGGELLGDICQKIETELKKTPQNSEAQALIARAAAEYEKFAKELADFTGVKTSGKAA